MAYHNDEIDLELNLEKNTLIVAPTRWGKTFELARVARWAYEHGYLPLFLTSNLTSLSADWEDKHTTLNHECNESFENVILNNNGLAALMENFLNFPETPYLYGSHRYSRWVKLFPLVAKLVKDMWGLKPLILCDEIHGTETGSLTNDYFRELTKIAPVIGVTATPHRIIRQDCWEEYKCITPPEGYKLPHTVDNVGLDRDTDLAQLFEDFTFSMNIKRHFDIEMYRRIWSICVINGTRYVADFQKPLIQYLRKEYPEATILHVAGKDYSLINGNQTVVLNEIFTGKAPQSVQQAITHLYDHEFVDERDSLKVIVIGHCKIEEGQTHGNFKGDRFAKLQLLATSKTVADDKFAQYVRLEPEKAWKHDKIEPIMLSDALQWADYQKGIEWIQNASKTLEIEGPDAELEPPAAYISSMKCMIGGVLVEETLTEEQIQELEYFTEFTELTIEGENNEVDNIFTMPRGSRDGSLITRQVRAHLLKEGFNFVVEETMRLMYEEGYETRFLTPEVEWRGGAQIVNLGGNKVVAIFPKTKAFMRGSRRLLEKQSWKIHDPRLDTGFRLRLRKKNVKGVLRP